MEKHGLPIWNGEFGPVYASDTDGPDWETVNEARYGVLNYQLSLYREKDISWSIWLWKGMSRRADLRCSSDSADIGYQGMVYVDRETPYMKLLKPFLEKKKVSIEVDRRSCNATSLWSAAHMQKLALDSWGCDRTPVNSVFDPIHMWMLEAAPTLQKRYPSQWKGSQHIDRVIRQCLLSVSASMSAVRSDI